MPEELSDNLQSTKKKNSRMATSALILVAVGYSFCLMDYVCQTGFLFIAGLVLAILAFMVGIAAIVVIAFNHKNVKGDWYALSAIFLSVPFLLLTGSAIYVNKVRSERAAVMKMQESKKTGSFDNNSMTSKIRN